MMKSLAFFLAVFAVGLVGLLFVSGDMNRWWKGSPASGGPAPEPTVSASASTPPAVSPAAVEKSGVQQPSGPQEKPPPDEIKIPVYDVVKGRLEYTFRGRLDENQLRNLENIQEIKAVTLRDGVLEVPIYDEIARELPRGEHQARQLVLTFASADYRASFRGSPAGGPARGEREREEVFLHGGGDRGMGKTDDGSEFRFEELVFTIDRTAEAENYFTIRSEKPVSVENAYLRLESPNGLEGKIFKNKGLQKLEFFPPVRCYLDPRAARLFSLGGPPQPATSPSEAPAAGGGSPADGAGSRKVAIACAGPMSFLLDSEPRTIRFQKDVSIFPLDGAIPEPGRPPPPPSTTRFDCQLLTIDVDSTVSPPQPSRAVATWEKGRVRAHHQGRIMEGDRLVWTLPARPAAGGAIGDQRGEAVLSGRPTVTGAEGRIETGEVVFKLDEDKVLLRKGLTGNFVATAGKGLQDADGPGPRGEGPSRSPAAGSKGPTPSLSDPAREAGGAPPGPPAAEEGLPRDWDFEAAEGELIFISANAPAARGKGAAADPAAERRLKRFIARASPERDLVIKSRDGGQYRLTGRTLDYDAKEGAVTIEGDEKTSPRLYRGGDQGTARSIQLLADEGRVVLRREVIVEIQDVRSALSRGEPAAPETVAPPKLPAASQAGGPVQVLADELHLRFDADHQLLGIEARQEAPSGRPATLKSLAPGSNYLLSGKTMNWNHREQVATVEGAEKESSGFASPRLEYEGGTLAAERIRFDRNSWRVTLLNRVAIRSCAAPRATAGGSSPAEEEAFDLRAGRAEVDLSEDLRPLGDGGCGWSRELRMVKSIHAWAPQDGAIELESKSYRGRAQEATWLASSQELHIFGEGRQEIGWLGEGRESTLTARDIVYACSRQSITLNGEVKGDLQIESPERAPGPSRAGTPASPAPALAREAETAPKGGPSQKARTQRTGETLLFNFQTGQVEAKVRENGDKLEVASLLARRNVLLWNDRYRLKLTGDELSFDKDRQELRMFSEEGRFQTLTYVQPSPESPPGKPATPAAARQPARVDQIDAREIWLWYRTPRTVPAAGAGAEVESVVVKFRDDVNATFYASDPGLLPSDPSSDQQRKWVLRSEHLGLKLSPTAEEREKIVQRALAEGNVIFSTKDSSGDYMAMAREAFYEEAQKKLTLRGDRQNPARLISGTKQVSYPEIAIYELGESRIKWKGWDEPRPVPEGFEELRRDPPPRR
jgi:hypothetical protein